MDRGKFLFKPLVSFNKVGDITSVGLLYTRLHGPPKNSYVAVAYNLACALHNRPWTPTNDVSAQF
jgi:hypothetical protein